MRAATYYVLIWCIFLVILLIYATLTLGCAPTQTEVQLSGIDRTAYWLQLERRLPAFFYSEGLPLPSLPSSKAFYAKARFFEFMSTDDSTCYFSEPDSIKVGNDKWASGCVPHEMGHMVLYMIGHPCWRNFEHPGGC